MSSTKRGPGRPATGRGVPYTFRSPETLHAEFFALIGEREAPALFRRFMRAWVGEGEMPVPPARTQEAA